MPTALSPAPQFVIALPDINLFEQFSMNDNDYSRQLDELRDVAARSINSCLTAKFIAFSDGRVRSLFLKKVHEGNVFRKVSCLGGITIPENRTVYFDFDCPPETICLIKPAFAAVVDIINGQVVAIVDPYIIPTVASDVQLPSVGNMSLEASDGTLPLANDGVLPLKGDGTLPLRGDGTLPLRVQGYIVLPAGWRFGNG